eukprot:TRINITY_DN47779_c0_g1_i1.p1 TRINITY_DN47779_c0_g1~~TRINITY_DN47779_c0_g1_i1.p1  ORF type:complete len:238 (+),score=36.95 TRINITY_DN47779_c0_g1_i1:105-818(+)
MSYTTTNKYLEVRHTYAPPKQSYVRGIWWPDFGPMTAEYSDQVKMHPTNTIFENQIVKPGAAKKELLADPMSKKGPVEQRFRKPAPQTEALWSSTIIQPYKSGGHAKERMEGAWHSKAKASHDAHEEAQATLIAKRTMDRQTLTASMSPTRSLSSPALNSLGGAGCSLIGGSSIFSSLADEAAPSWVASQTIASRELDSAGLCGAGGKSSMYKTGASEFGLDPSSAAATVIARTRRS